jgi:hypothetical protein
MQYVIRYETGPDLVGPFPTEREADEWAASYEVQYRDAEGPLDLEWTVERLTSPESLEWWN